MSIYMLPTSYIYVYIRGGGDITHAFVNIEAIIDSSKHSNIHRQLLSASKQSLSSVVSTVLVRKQVSCSNGWLAGWLQSLVPPPQRVRATRHVATGAARARRHSARRRIARARRTEARRRQSQPRSPAPPAPPAVRVRVRVRVRVG